MLWEQGEANDADKPLPNPSLYLDERKTSWLMQRSRTLHHAAFEHNWQLAQPESVFAIFQATGPTHDAPAVVGRR